MLPKLSLPSLTTGKRFALPRPIGSADALLISRFAAAQKAQGKLTAVVVADPADTARLLDEMAFFEPQLRCAVFPDWETLPYDTFSPHQDLISERLATLWRVQQGVKAETGVDLILLPATTALTRLAPPSFLAAYTFHFKQKQKLDEAALKSQLTLAGYTHVSQVVSPGEYAVRGGLIDLYPMGSLVPYRVDLFGDEVDSIRTFDPDTQRSLYPVPEVRLLPGREFPMDDAARGAFRNRWRERIEGDPTKSRVYKDIGTGVATAGIEYYLPLFFDETSTIFQHLGEHAQIVLHGDIDDALRRFWVETRERHRFLQHDPERPILPPEDLFLKPEDFFTLANAHAQLAIRGNEPTDWARPLPDLSVERGGQDPLRKLEQYLARTGNRTLVVAESAGRRESLLELLRDHRIELPSIDSLQAFADSDHTRAIVVAPLAGGFIWQDAGADTPGLQFITETELFDAAPTTRRRRKADQATDVDSLIKDLS
ncbi:MAG: transcription-repair coupling factor, partial [Aquabacterium sp.]|nr:transcription-repair coupling factor [Aquabacterium sp.]